LSQATVATDRPDSIANPADAAQAFVCAWCRGEISESSPEQIKLTENFSICNGCLEDRLRVLDRTPARTVRRNRA
jgi:hypothetical protein